MVYALLSLILIGVWLFGLFDVLTAADSEVRYLPKFAWFLVVLLGMLPGAVLWFMLGRVRVHVPPPSNGSAPLGAGNAPKRLADPPKGPEDDPEFLRDLERRLRDDDR